MSFRRLSFSAPLCLALLATACGSDDKKVSSQSIEGMPGLWLEAKVADAMHLNPNLGDADCAAILGTEFPVMHIDASGGIFEIDPATKKEKKDYTIQNGQLVPEPEYKDMFKDTTALISRVGDRLAIDFTQTKDGKIVDSGRILLGRVSEDEAAKLDGVSRSCARTPIPGRINDLPIKDGRMVVTGDASGTFDFNADNGGYASCSLEDGKVTAVFMRKESDTFHSSVGVLAILPSADLASGNVVKVSLLSSTMNLPDQRNDYFVGDCTASVKRTKHVLDINLECPEMQRRLNNVDQKVHVTGTYACLASVLDQKK